MFSGVTVFSQALLNNSMKLSFETAFQEKTGRTHGKLISSDA